MQRPKSIEEPTAYKVIFALLGLCIAGLAGINLWLWGLGLLLGWTISWGGTWLLYAILCDIGANDE